MSTEFVWLKAENTGKVGKYPANFVNRPGLVPVDGNKEGCLDCTHVEDEAVVGEPVDKDTQELTYDWSEPDTEEYEDN